jgi:outer membrane protein assembly factor BamA
MLTTLLFLVALNPLPTHPLPAVLSDSLTLPTRAIVRSVRLDGNLRTRDRIIRREIELRPGDTIALADLPAKLDWDRNKIANTNLFVTVAVTAQLIGADTTAPGSLPAIDVLVTMKERWYLIVYPVFDLADRNFNEWWYQRNRDPRRIVYGGRLSYRNLTGNNDKLGLRVELGFLRRFGVEYQIPYIDRAQRIGLRVEATYLTNNELAYRSQFDKLVFVRDQNALLREQQTLTLGLTRRANFYGFEELQLNYTHTDIADTVARLNPDYFLDGRVRQRYLRLSYSFRYDRRDNVAYPLRGTLAGVQANWLGLLPTDDLRQLEVVGSYGRFWPLPWGRPVALTDSSAVTTVAGRAARYRWFVSSGLRGQVILPQQQPYNLLRGLGYNQEVVRGYELYSIEGQHFALWKNTLRFQLFNTVRQLRWLRVRQFNTVPVAAYLTVFADAGYVWNSYRQPYQSILANQLLTGAGLSLDVVTFYNLVGRLSIARNGRGETGFFFNIAQEL